MGSQSGAHSPICERAIRDRWIHERSASTSFEAFAQRYEFGLAGMFES